MLSTAQRNRHLQRRGVSARRNELGLDARYKVRDSFEHSSRDGAQQIRIHSLGIMQLINDKASHLNHLYSVRQAVVAVYNVLNAWHTDRRARERRRT